MGTYDPLIEASTLCSSKTRQPQSINHEMCICPPCPCRNDFSRRYIFRFKVLHGRSRNIQGANADIATAAESLQTKEAAVATLVDQAAAIFTAEQALETAVDVAAYGNKFDLVNDDDTEIL